MVALLFLLTTSLLGYYLIKFFLGNKFPNASLLLCCSFIIGVFTSVWIVFGLSFIFSFYLAIWIGWESIAICILILHLTTKHTSMDIIFSKTDLLILALFLAISALIMRQTLSESAGIIKIGQNVYADFEMHLPLIRSFTWGDNVPPRAPFYPSGKLAYHFFFDFWTAMIESLGLSIATAFNVVSTLAMACFLYILYAFSQHLFSVKSRLIGLLTVLFFFCNSSLGFLDAWKKLQPNGIFDFLVHVWNNRQYLSVQPFQNDFVSITWNLNVYTNQRHLIFGLAVDLILLYLVKNISHEKKENLKYYLFLGLLLGGLPFWQTQSFICFYIVLVTIYLLNLKHKLLLVSIAIATFLAGFQALFLSSDITNSFSFHPGYLTYLPVTISNFSLYWTFNFGLSIITIPIGFLYARWEAKKIFIGVFLVFIIANIFQFNKEMFNNHKFFNFFIIIGNCFTAYLVYRILRIKLGMLVVFPLVFLLILSGVFDLAVLKNETFIPVVDYSNNTLMRWVKDNTPPSSVFLVSTDMMYHPIRMAGRKTFQFNPRYAWAYGYNIETTDYLAKQMFAVSSPKDEMNLLKKSSIRYVVIPTYNPAGFNVDSNYFSSNFQLVYDDGTQKIYLVAK